MELKFRWQDAQSMAEARILPRADQRATRRKGAADICDRASIALPVEDRDFGLVSNTCIRRFSLVSLPEQKQKKHQTRFKTTSLGRASHWQEVEEEDTEARAS